MTPCLSSNWTSVVGVSCSLVASSTVLPLASKIATRGAPPRPRIVTPTERRPAGRLIVGAFFGTAVAAAKARGSAVLVLFWARLLPGRRARSHQGSRPDDHRCSGQIAARERVEAAAPVVAEAAAEVEHRDLAARRDPLQRGDRLCADQLDLVAEQQEAACASPDSSKS